MFKDFHALKFSLKVAKIKNHRPLLYLSYLAENAKEGKTPQVNYHRKCRSLFTMKRDQLESISQKTGAKQIIELIWKRRDLISKSQTRAQLTQIYTIFRKEVTAYKKGTRRCDPLTQQIDFCLDAEMRKAAIAASDIVIIGLGRREKLMVF